MKKKEELGLNQFLSNAETAKGSMQKFSDQTSIFDIDYSEFEITNEVGIFFWLCSNIL